MVRLISGRDFRLIWSAGLISQLGDWSARLALALLVLERSGSAAMVGVVGVLFTVPWLGIGQLLTAWSARYSRRAVLVSCDLFRAGAFLIIGAIDMPMAPLLAIVGLAALVDPVFEATKSAFVTEMVPKREYSEAVQSIQAAGQAASLGGYAAGGVLVGLLGAEITLSLNGLTFLVSTILMRLISRKGPSETGESARPNVAAGVAFLRRDPIVRIGFLTTVLTVATAMSVESQVPVYAKVVADMGDQTIGLLSATTPAASLVAVLFMKHTSDDVLALRRGLWMAGVTAAGAGALLFMGVGNVLVFVAFALLGVMFSFVAITNVVVGRRLPDKNRVTIFSILQSAVFGALSVGTLLGGIASEWTNPERAAGGALALGAVGLLAAIPSVAEPPQHAQPRVKRSK